MAVRLDNQTCLGLFLLWMFTFATANNYIVKSVFIDKCLPLNSPTEGVNHMVMDVNTGDIFIGAVNCLMRVDEHLQAFVSQTLGPKNDSAYCNPDQQDQACCQESPCPSNRQRKLKNNTVKSMLINYEQSDILVCTDLGLGNCSKFGISKPPGLSLKIDNSHTEHNVVPFDDQTEVEMILLKDEAPNRLLVATRPPIYSDSPYHGEIYSMTVRNYATLQPQRGFSQVGFKSKKNFDIHYKHIFTSGLFTYVLAVQPREESDVLGQKTYVTRIGRICNKDERLKLSYVEMPLECRYKGEDYSILLAAAVNKPGSRLADSLHLISISDDSDHVLIAAFARPQEQGSVDPTPGTVLCMYKLRDIRSAFTSTIRQCSNGTGNLGPAHFGVPSDQCQVSFMTQFAFFIAR